ncbi:MAG: transcription elongation factor GreA [Dehalococcoidia bacterium]
MTQEAQVLLVHAVTQYMEQSTKRNPDAIQEELSRFVRWCGRDRFISSLTPQMMEDYSGTLDGVGQQGSQRLTILKGFLIYLNSQSWTETNLATHAKLRRSGRKAPTSKRLLSSGPASQLTSEGHQRLAAELAKLKGERANVAEEIRLAAATKDFSENAPLDAAREHQGQLEARVRELEGILEGAMILEESKGKAKAGSRIAIGSRVVLQQAQTGQKVSYLIVESSEADPTAGKLSAASPVGKAILDRAVGDEVAVATPRGAVRYRVAKVGR